MSISPVRNLSDPNGSFKPDANLSADSAKLFLSEPLGFHPIRPATHRKGPDDILSRRPVLRFDAPPIMAAARHIGCLVGGR
jgi:hypothetical protein